MKIIRTAALTLLAGFSAVVALGVTAAPAQAQATRTWVSGVGDDANPCSRTAPCKTFAGAISKTATNGEINCLDPAGYGAVNITKGMTIDCGYTHGSILAANTNGVIINGAGINVILRGININGASTTTGNGIRFIQGASLTLDNVIIENMSGTTGSNGRCLIVETGTATETFVTDSSFVNCGQNGIEVTPTANTARLVVRDSSITNNTSNGVRLNAAAGTVIATIDDTEISGSATGISLAANFAINVMVHESSMTNNTTGLAASGSGTLALVGNSSIFGNGTGLSVSGGANVRSYGNNRLNFNSVTDGAFTPPIVSTK